MRRAILTIAAIGLFALAPASAFSQIWRDESDEFRDEPPIDEPSDEEQYEDYDQPSEQDIALADYYSHGDCDPNYGLTADGHCVINFGGDIDCPWLWSLGIGDIPVMGTDWMRLDGYQDFETGEWISPPDGLGCEWNDAGAEYTRPSLSAEPESTVGIPAEIVVTPDPTSNSQRAVGNQCLAVGEFVCAQENLVAAYASAQDAGTKSDLYEFYLVTGDGWQHEGNLESARRGYNEAVRLDPTRTEATERLQHLASYTAVEFFDSFDTFGRHGLNETVDGGATVHRVANGVFELTSTMPEWESIHYFSGTPSSANYAITTEVSSVGPSTVLGLILAHGPAGEGFRFFVDPALQQWWIAYRNPDGSWTDMVLPVSYAGQIQSPIERLEVQVINDTPTFIVNDTDLTASFDMTWMQIPRTGNTGVAVASSMGDLAAPISATFDSFGIYAL